MKFPQLHITEDVKSIKSYWVNIQICGQWLVIEKTTSRGIGLSTVKAPSLDFSGHDLVVGEVDQAFEWAVRRLEAFLAE